MNRLLIIDGNAYLYRAFHATPRLTSKSGVHTNAIKGFINILLSDIAKLQPTHVLVTFDRGGKPNWRSEIYPEYKKNRDKDKNDPKNKQHFEDMKIMHGQREDLRKLLRAMGIRILHKKGCEADDLMATVAVKYAEKGWEVVISTNDKDMMQLCSKQILIHRSDRKLCGPAECRNIFGVKPKQIVCYLSLVGDKADNIAGIYGCGGKTAAKWLGEHKSLEGVMKAIKEKRLKLTPKMSEAYKAVRKAIKDNPQIITLKSDVAHNVTTADLVFPSENMSKKKITEICERLGMRQTLTILRMSPHKWKSAPPAEAGNRWSKRK